MPIVYKAVATIEVSRKERKRPKEMLSDGLVNVHGLMIRDGAGSGVG